MDKQEKKQIRKDFTTLGIALLIYMLLMNLCVILVCFSEIAAKSLTILLQEGTDTLFLLLNDLIYDSLLQNGWGYLLAITLGLLLLRFWKGKQFIRRDLWVSSRDMTVGSFFSLLVLFLSGQTLFMWLSYAQEMVLNLFGFSAIYALDAATASYDTFSMFLYSALLAPISEEILFRGVVLRSLEPHGKRFAILLSAFLFGIFHGNLVQSPFAFFVGIILGYTALEYNILWAMLLHMINNLVLSDMFYRLLPMETADIVINTLIYICFIFAVILYVVKRKQIREYIHKNPVNNQIIAQFFSSWGILLFLILMELSALGGLTRI